MVIQRPLKRRRMDTHGRLRRPPFEVPLNRRRQPNRDAALLRSAQFRSANVPYSKGRRALGEEGRHIGCMEYYNTLRSVRVTNSKGDTQLQAILACLDGADWRHRILHHRQHNDAGEPEPRPVAVQIVFTSSYLITLTKQCASGWVIIVDATFRTNTHRFPLLIANGVDSMGHTFPFLFSWTLNGSTETFRFFFERMSDVVFNDGAHAPRVLLTDQASGSLAWHAGQAQIAQAGRLAAAAAEREARAAVVEATGPTATTLARQRAAEAELDVRGIEAHVRALREATDNVPGSNVAAAEGVLEGAAMLGQTLQLCEWHAAEAMRARIVKGDYIKEKQENLHKLTWAYVKADTPLGFHRSRKELLAALRPAERTYVETDWVPKE